MLHKCVYYAQRLMMRIDSCMYTFVLRSAVIVFAGVATLTTHANSGESVVSLSVLGMDAHFVAILVLFMGCLLAGAHGVAYALQRFVGIPTVAGYIIAGVVLGSSGLDIASWFPFSHAVTVGTYATTYAELGLFFLAVFASAITVPYLLFIAGYETNMEALRSVGHVAVYAGFFGAILPIVMVVGAFMVLPGMQGWGFIAALGVGLACSATSVSIPVAFLTIRHRMHTKSSRATLGAAIVDDVVAIILLSLFFIVALQGAGESIAVEKLALMVGMLAATLGGLWVLGRYVLPPVLRTLVTDYHMPIAATATVLMFFLFAYTELLGGLAGLTGAYFAGMIFNYAGADREHLVLESLLPLVNGALLPLFLITIGLQLSVSGIGPHALWVMGVLLAAAIISKLVGCFMATSLTAWLHPNAGSERFSTLDSYLFGAGMVARGEVGFVIASILRGFDILTKEQHSIVIIVLVLTTIAAPLMLQVGFALEKGDEDTPVTH